MERLQNFGMGYLRDLPDLRDFHGEIDGIKSILKASKPLKDALKATPASVDLRAWCHPSKTRAASVRARRTPALVCSNTISGAHSASMSTARAFFSTR
jgi:hypothetical protein